MLLHGDDLELARGSATDELVAGNLASPEDHVLRVKGHFLRHAYRHDPLASLNNARIEPQPHQVFVAHRVTRKLQPRMILADEVGLGKTIEAGLIIKELRARQQLERVLVVAPASLTRQWQSELAAKFNEHFELIDGAAAAYLGKDGRNPFLSRNNVICSLSFATNKKRAEQVLEGNWDLVVFDEAHRVRRTKQRETGAYKLADELKDHVSGLLLLTATPVQLEQYELYSLVQLVEPGLFKNVQTFDAQRAKIPELNQLMLGLDRWEALPGTERRGVFDRHRPLLARVGCASVAQLDDDDTRSRVMSAVTAQHPLADVMVRNRKAELGLAGRRVALTEAVALSTQERELYDDVTAYIREGYDRAKRTGNLAAGFLMVTHQKMLTSSSHALRTSFRRRIAKLEGQRRAVRADLRRKQLLDLEYEDPPEMSELAEAMAEAELDEASYDFEIQQLTALAERLDNIRDCKMSRAVELVQGVLSKAPEDKVVVFTQFMETQAIFARALNANGVSTVLFNGAMDSAAKERAVRDFRERAAVLVSTEAGGEGRNLQFANHLVNYDLPWNPMKVEQRIGRLDRIGQKKTVFIYNLISTGTLEDRVLTVLRDRIRLFEQSVGALDPILGTFEKDIERLALAVPVEEGDAAFSTFSTDLDERLLQARAVEKRLADFVLDRASLRRDQLNELQGFACLASQDEVAAFCRSALERFGGYMAEHEDGGQVIGLAQRSVGRLGLSQKSYRGVFGTDEALRRDELDFFAFGHELVDKLVAAAVSIDGADVGARRSASVPTGTWIEVVYEVRSSVGQQRGALVRHLVGPDLAVVSAPMRAVPEDEPIEAEPPAWTAAAVRCSQDHFDEEFAALRAGWLSEFVGVRQERLLRERRLYDYKRDRLELQVKTARQWLAEHDHEEVGAKDRKVLPARRGKLKKDLERLALLHENYQLECERLRAQEPEIGASVAWAAVVVGA